MDICDFLILQGLITSEDALEIRDRARRYRLSPVRSVLKAGIATAESLLQKLIDYTGLEAVDPTMEEADPDALRLIAHETALEKLFLPLSFQEEHAEHGSFIRLRAAAADPFMNLEDISDPVGFDLSIVLSSADLLEIAIAKNYSSMITKILPMMDSEPAFKDGAGKMRTEHRKEFLAKSFPQKPAAKGFIEIPTVPSHNIEDDVPPTTRIQAIVNLLCKHGLITREDYLREIRKLTEFDDREP